MPIWVIDSKKALVEETFTVPNIVMDLRDLFLCDELLSVESNRHNLFLDGELLVVYE